MNIDKEIECFSFFLTKSWDCIIPLLFGRTYTSDDDSVNDWLQANWELLIERKVLPLNEYLEVYGDGADFNGASSRITDKDRISTYYLLVLVHDGIDLLTGERISKSNFLFEKLVGFEAGYYMIAPPFNYVLVMEDNNNTERVFHIRDVSFELCKLSETNENRF